MAEVFVSPGVYTQEIDDTFVPAGAGTIGAALIGRTSSGPAFRPTRVNNFNEFRTVFSLSPKQVKPQFQLLVLLILLWLLSKDVHQQFLVAHRATLQ